MNLSTHKKSEVDLRVAQELKNNNDFIYQTNQSLQNLKKGLEEVKVLAVETKRITERDIKNALSMYENIRESAEEKLHDFDVRLSDIEAQVFAFKSYYLGCINDLKNHKLSKGDHAQAVDDQKALANKLSNEFQNNLKLIDQKLISLKDSLSKDVLDVYSHIPTVPDEEPYKKTVQDSLDIISKNFEGLVKEIAILKKASHYDEKKFENVYTLIERLKADNVTSR